VLKDLILKNRSCRRFYQEHKVDTETLRELADLARLSPSAQNLQPLKYILSTDPEKNKLIFSCLTWAGYLKDWSPPEGERPAAYILILGDKRIASSFAYDAGIAAQSILLGAREKDLAGCILGSVQREKIRGLLKIPEQYEILLAIALGKPKEKVVLEEVGPDGDIKYWRDSEGVHHVPKRSLEELIIG
jgi:nitroreductase